MWQHLFNLLHLRLAGPRAIRHTVHTRDIFYATFASQLVGLKSQSRTVVGGNCFSTFILNAKLVARMQCIRKLHRPKSVDGSRRLLKLRFDKADALHITCICRFELGAALVASSFRKLLRRWNRERSQIRRMIQHRGVDEISAWHHLNYNKYKFSTNSMLLPSSHVRRPRSFGPVLSAPKRKIFKLMPSHTISSGSFRPFLTAFESVVFV